MKKQQQEIGEQQRKGERARECAISGSDLKSDCPTETGVLYPNKTESE